MRIERDRDAKMSSFRATAHVAGSGDFRGDTLGGHLKTGQRSSVPGFQLFYPAWSRSGKPDLERQLVRTALQPVPVIEAESDHSTQLRPAL